MKRWVFNPSLNCSRLTEVERRRVGSEFQTTGAATWKLRWPNRVLVRGTSMSQRSAERRCTRQEMSATGHRRPWSMGRCRGHSQKQLRPPCKGSAGALAANEAHHEELGLCVQTCQHRRSDGLQCSEPSAADGWPAPTRRSSVSLRTNHIQL